MFLLVIYHQHSIYKYEFQIKSNIFLLSDDHVLHKLGKSAWIPGDIRCQLCQDAIHEEGIQASSWISVSRGECQFNDGFMNFDFITENLRDFLNSILVGSDKLFKYPLTVVYVCGLDHFNKCSRVISLSREEHICCAIVYRTGYDEKRILNPGKSSNMIYVPLADERHNLIDVSSTRIRQCFENSNNDAKQITYSSVVKYMTEKHKK